MDSELKEIRKNNFKRILEDKCDGNKNKAALLLDVQRSTIDRYYNGTRGIGDIKARDIERIFHLPKKYLDTREEGDDVYYITAKVNGSFIYQFVNSVKQFDEIKECSAVLGDFDVLLKVKVNSFHILETASSKINRLPGVIRTRTYHAIPTLRWQKEQEPYELLISPFSEKRNYLEELIDNHISHHLGRAAELEKGEISILEDEKRYPVELDKMYRSAQKSLLIIRMNTRDKKIDANLLEAERTFLLKENTSSKRIIVLSKDDAEFFNNQYTHLKTINDMYLEIGSQVVFVFRSTWRPSGISTICENFVVVDNEYTMVRRIENGAILFKRELYYLENYRNCFENNWNNGYSFNGLVDRYFKSP